MATRILLVEDHRLVREILAQSLGSDANLEIVGEVGSAVSAVEATRTLQPQIVVVDIGLPDMNGIQLTALLLREWPGLKIIALSAYEDPCFVKEMMRAGANAYVTKSSATLELRQAIHAVMEGKSYFSCAVATTLARQYRGQQDAGAPPLGRREREVLKLVAQGKKSPGIAQELRISVGTVDVHRRNIMRKLDLHSVAELTAYAIREGLVLL
ncbi:response regulator [Azohydromonas aeria]|uniref:response regulator n=1 Tax=Azohydromonas aeria TaxID=2590212 RepID=UPI0012F974D5|nr:response regulator transcription factor [Azohydromonas aeria]